MDDPPEPQCHEKGQKENDSSTKLVALKVGSGGKQRDEDVQPDSLSKAQAGQVKCGADEPAPQNHSRESSEENLCYEKKKVADNAASSSGIVAHDTTLSSPRRNACVFSQGKHCSTPGWRLSKMRFHDTILPPLK